MGPELAAVRYVREVHEVVALCSELLVENTSRASALNTDLIRRCVVLDVLSTTE